jgi:hypothetical protein
VSLGKKEALFEKIDARFEKIDARFEKNAATFGKQGKALLQRPIWVKTRRVAVCNCLRALLLSLQ